MGDLLIPMIISACLTIAIGLLAYRLGYRSGSHYWQERADLADERATDIAKRADFYEAQYVLQTRKYAEMERQFKYLQEQMLSLGNVLAHPAVILRPDAPHPCNTKESSNG